MVDHTLAEEWRAVEGHPGYEVSSLGRVRSVDRWVETENGQNRFYRGQIVVPWLNEWGRLSVALGRQGKARVSRLVCLAFHGPSPSHAHEAAHWDNDPLNNRPSNLRWATSKENKADMLRHGTRVRGERVGTSKLTEEQVGEIKRLRGEGMKMQDLADKFGVSQPLISGICNGTKWGHVS